MRRAEYAICRRGTHERFRQRTLRCLCVGARTGKNYTGSTWMIGNTPMVRDPGFYTLSLAAAGSVAGKAHVVGEWEVPTPNQYASEHAVLPVLYAAYQDLFRISFPLRR